VLAPFEMAKVADATVQLLRMAVENYAGVGFS
jgi:hypothetical protein